MGRPYTSSDYARLVGHIHAALPDVAVTTDVIVGFPGETDRQFRRTVALARELGFSRVHVFPYSARPGTPAAARSDQVRDDVKRERTQQMLAVAAELARSAARARLGLPASVLFEERDGGGMLTGLTPHYVRVHSAGPDTWLGRIVDVTVEREEGGELFAGV
jgi:threonylcarbamoyladenosine tRNA methylthiotransferase MtaB